MGDVNFEYVPGDKGTNDTAAQKAKEAATDQGQVYRSAFNGIDKGLRMVQDWVHLFHRKVNLGSDIGRQRDELAGCDNTERGQSKQEYLEASIEKQEAELEEVTPALQELTAKIETSIEKVFKAKKSLREKHAEEARTALAAALDD